MKALPIAELLELPVEERIRLVKILWDSIAAVPEAVALPEEWKAELERRLAEFEADPEAGSPWDEVRSRIVQGEAGAQESARYCRQDQVRSRLRL